MNAIALRAECATVEPMATSKAKSASKKNLPAGHPAPPSRDASADMTAVSLRISPVILTRADALISHVTDRIGAQAVRSDVLRIAVLEGLKVLEKESST